MSENDKKDSVSGLTNSFGKQLNVGARVFVPSFGINNAASSAAPESTTPANENATSETNVATTDKTDPGSTNSVNTATKSPDAEEVADDWEANADEDDEEEDEGEGDGDGEGK